MDFLSQAVADLHLSPMTRYTLLRAGIVGSWEQMGQMLDVEWLAVFCFLLFVVFFVFRIQ